MPTTTYAGNDENVQHVRYGSIYVRRTGNIGIKCQQQTKLVQYVLENKDGENTKVLCEQLYDLALISHRQLTPEEMTKFVARSNEIMLMLAK